MLPKCADSRDAGPETITPVLAGAPARNTPPRPPRR